MIVIAGERDMRDSRDGLPGGRVLPLPAEPSRRDAAQAAHRFRKQVRTMEPAYHGPSGAGC